MWDHLLEVKSLKHLTNLTLHDRITKSLLHLHKKKKPPSISAQFQVTSLQLFGSRKCKSGGGSGNKHASLTKLMETLGQAEPYFVKCIRSNAEKASWFKLCILLFQLPLRFNDNLVLRQLRYTGMLETVRIRQSGYSCKYSFQDFVDHFHVLLPRGTVPSKQNIEGFFKKTKTNSDSFQVGRTMVFMKEQGRQLLQGLLHEEVLRRIVLLQSWFRTMLYRRHFLSMRQAAVIIQRRKQAETEDESLTHSAFLEQAAVVLQAYWRGYMARRRFQQMQIAGFILQSSWRDCLRRRHAAATSIQAHWRSYHTRTLYRAKRSKIILLQAAYRGYKARQRFTTLREQRLSEASLKNRLTSNDDKLILGYNSDIKGSDPSKWEDNSFEKKTIEDYASFTDNRIDPSNSLHKHHERANSQSGMSMEEEVLVRERPKSLEDLNQKKGVRAKRESRRMRELEQAIFSLELLKVRSTSGTSPSEEHQLSPDFVSEGMPSPRRTPESKSSRGSLEKLNRDPLSPLDHSVYLRESLHDSPKFDDDDDDDNDDDDEEEEEDISKFAAATINKTMTERKRSISSSELLDCLAVKERLSVCHSYDVASNKHTRESLISSSLPTFYLPPQDKMKVGHSVRDNNLRNKQMEMGSNFFFPDTKKNPQLERITRSTALHDNGQMSGSGEFPAVTATEMHLSDTVIEKLEKLNVEKEERRKRKQMQNEKEMMEQIRQQTEILEKQHKVFEELQRQEDEQNRIRDSCHGTPLISPKKMGRGPPLVIGHPQVKEELKLATNAEATSSVVLRSPTGPPKGSPPVCQVALTEKIPEKKEGQTPVILESVGTDWLNLQRGAESQKSLSNLPAREKRFRLPRIPSQGKESSSKDTRVGSIFFTPKDAHLGNTDNKSSVPPLLPKEDQKKPLKLPRTDRGEVARPVHRKKARMARTRSNFLTRGAFADWEGDTEEEDCDDNLEFLLSFEHPPHLEPGCAVRLGQPCHSDSEMMLQRSASNEGQAKLHKTMSQGEIGKLPVAQKIVAVDRSSACSSQGNSEQNLYFFAPAELSPPRSPELSGIYRRECKENKEPSPKVKRKRSLKISNVTMEPAQWQNDALQIITSASDLKSMDEFLLKKMNDLDTEDCKKDTLVDVVFKKALKEFRQNIFSFYSSALAMGDGKSIRYKDLYALFEQILEKTMKLEQRNWSESPVRVWVNTFKVFLDEYMTEYMPLDFSAAKVTKTERKKRRKKETDIYDPELSSRQFGVELSRLTSEERIVPTVFEKLTSYIEMHALYTEGIYRKSGSTNKVKELRQGLDTDIERVNLDDYNIHVIASVFKQWLRDLPNPLMTFELYEEFLRAMGLLRAPVVKFHCHSISMLFRIALQEETNRMSANALAIVFAPCILRCPDTTDPLQSAQDVSKTISCVELIVIEQMNKYRARLKDISSLEFAENKAKSRLSLIRRSMGKGRLRRGTYPSPTSPAGVRLPSMADAPEEALSSEEAMEMEVTEQQQVAMQQEEKVLAEQIESLQKEKEELTFEMLALEPRASDDETLESEASIGTADSSENLNFDSEGAISDKSGRSLTFNPARPGKADPVGTSRSRRQLRKQPESVDSVDSLVSSPSLSPSSSSSCLPHVTRKRFQIYSKSPFYRAAPAGDAGALERSPGHPKVLDDRPQFTTRGTFNPEKGKQKLKNVKISSPKAKELPEGSAGPGRKRHPEAADYMSPQQLVLLGNNEFMV
ncbi:Myosin-IXa, partial [Ophiophagus hannah]